MNALVVHPATGQREVLEGVIHREDILGTDAAPRKGGGGWEGNIQTPKAETGAALEYVANSSTIMPSFRFDLAVSNTRCSAGEITASPILGPDARSSGWGSVFCWEFSS